MIPIPDDLSDRDCHQWLNGGWCAVNTSRGTRVGVYQGKDGELLVMRVYVDQGDGTVDSITNRYAHRNVHCHWPLLGAINWKPKDKAPCALYVQRTATRTYGRTYHSKLVRLSMPGRYYIMRNGGDPQALGPKLADSPLFVQSLFWPEYVDVDEARVRFEKGWASVAVHPHIILVADGPDRLRVYYHGDYAALIEGNVIQAVHEAHGDAHRLNKLMGGVFLV